MCATVPAVLPNLQQKYGGFFNATNAIRLVKELPLPMVRNEQKKWKKKDAKQSERKHVFLIHLQTRSLSRSAGHDDEKTRSGHKVHWLPVNGILRLLFSL